MDESWRMRMGMPTTTKTGLKHNPPPRRSTEDTSYRQTSESPLLDPEDFNDVFGGPPRTVMSRQFPSNEYFLRSSSTSSFYEEIFRPPENVVPAPAPVRSGRNLPEFRIPAEKGARRSNQFEGFYGDIFGWNEEDLKRSRSRTRSRSKSKTSTSSVLSSEELSPLRPAIGGGELGDEDVSFFASRLRPLNVPRRWTSNTAIQEELQEQQSMSAFVSSGPSYDAEFDYNENFRGSNFRFCRRNPSPETISLEPNSYRSLKVSADDLEHHNSPSSVISSLCQDQEAVDVVANRTEDQMSREQAMEQDEDEVVSSYVIEINAGNREWAEEAVGVDDAIAWAKEKFQTCCSEDMLGADQISDGHKDGNESTHVAGDEEQDTWTNAEQKRELGTDMEMELLNEKIRLWSTGKEADIRLLLSTLHHILWPDSGWLAVPLTNLIESSHVKKAYQKARLILHPDKLQQRGASFPQKYVAEKAFPILQDAWAAFVSQDVFCT
ncbi:unnamed protein product [Coffea canephora]|uniref:J domain-containing protein n=1 Tax=Coffea canephora TaxID=49390 RepID=A0A068URT6_COFCA|nr:unnamed protein product [Coffea canephora]